VVAGIVSGIATSAVSDSLREEFALQIQQSAELLVSKERTPVLRGLGASFRHDPGDGALGDIDTELQEFPVDARRTPQGIRRGHLPHNKGGDLGLG
jgi:hypothetical protein